LSAKVDIGCLRNLVGTDKKNTLRDSHDSASARYENSHFHCSENPPPEYIMVCEKNQRLVENDDLAILAGVADQYVRHHFFYQPSKAACRDFTP